MISRYRRITPHILRQWSTLLLILFLTCLASGVTALQPWPLKILVDYALGQEAIPEVLRSLLGGLPLETSPTVLVSAAALSTLGLFILNSSLEVGLAWTWTAAGQRMVYDLASELFHRLQRLSPLFHSRRSVGDSLSRLMDDTYCVYTLSEALLVSPIQHSLTLLIVGVIAWNLDPQLTVLSMIVAPTMVGAAIFFGKRLKQRARQNREAQSRVLSFVHQALGSIPVVQAFTTEERNRQQFQLLAESAVSVSQRGVLVKSSYGLVNGLMMAVGTAIVLYFGGQRVLSGALSMGSLLVFLAYLRSIHSAFSGFQKLYGKLKAGEASIDRVMEVLEAEERVEEAPGAKPLPARARGHVRLEHVTFGYEANVPVLRDVSLEAQPGEVVALVGPTGAGKSTLVSLIPRFFDPWQGQITFDGTDVRQVKLSSLRAQVSLVLQEPFLLPLTVAENIAYGRPSANREEIMAAARAANADEFIQRLPQGYETVIGERGVTLSGGQRQRLSIARALLKDAPVLILDEPTSALDAGTETVILEALERLIKDRTTFIIAHRLSTIRKADKIVVLEGGKVVETGSHQELLEADGLYQLFYSHQYLASSPEMPT